MSKLNRTLSQWLNYLETLHPKTMDLGLERVDVVAKKCALTDFLCPVVTIAGTNGKGSTVAFLESITCAAQHKVGAYTSPHLIHFNERIRINGEDVSDQQLCNALEVIEEARGDITLTFFEFTTLAALYLFKQAALDLVLLEVGLGGRLDAVNIVDSDIAVITSIALDHQQWLGEDREAIGFEKSGIMRAGKPVICGDPNPPQSLIDHAKKISANLYGVQKENGIVNHNAAIALSVIRQLQDQMSISDDAIRCGLANVNLPGRVEIVEDNDCYMILDVAHNPAATTHLAQRLSEIPCNGKTHAVVGMLKDKDINGSLEPLISLADVWYVADLHCERSASGERIVEELEDLGVKQCYNHSAIEKAILHAKQLSSSGDRIVVFGSFHTVSQAKLAIR